MKHLSPEIRVPIELDNPAIRRIEGLCIKCGQCRDVCRDVISVGGHYDLLKTKDTAVCIHCGQCVQVCPTDALCEQNEAYLVKNAIADPNKIVVFMTSPSVRVALGEPFGKKAGTYVEEQMVAGLRKLGADYVFDTTFAADLTIMEEASELIDRVTNNKPLPQFTSCCPAWVKFVETYYPQYLPNISSSKSPISMFSPTVKSYFAKQENIDPSKIITVALTPCTAKKFEVRRAEMRDALPDHPDTDYVITTKELAAWMKMENLDLDTLEPSDYDSPMPRGSGAGIIFGNSGGVMEAAVRTAYFMLTGENPPQNLIAYEPLRGLDGVKTCDVTIQNLTLHLAVVSGTDHARQFIDQMEHSDKSYHFIEVMTCPGGCISGGGQPKHLQEDMNAIRKQRMDGLYQMDEKLTLRFSHENPEILRLYETFYGKPLSEIAEKMLHTKYQDRSDILGEDPSVYRSSYQQEAKQEPKTSSASSMKWKCTICGYIYEGDIHQEPDDYQCPICFAGKAMFEAMETPAAKVETTEDIRYKCTVCGYIYEGDITQEPDDYTCPICTVPKSLFEKMQ